MNRDVSMNKAELVNSIAQKSKMTKKDSETALNAIIKSVEDTLKKGEKISLVGFGSFEVRKRKARKGMNPQTKEAIKIPAKKVPVFKAGKGLREAVNKKKK
jgi:DNA-binding protein HU-beta